MKPKFPKLINDLIQASNEINEEKYKICFTENATVADDGDFITGRKAIGHWFLETRKKFAFQTEPLEVQETTDKIILKARVTGDFRGSPILFEYHMELNSGLIQNLEINVTNLPS